MFLRKLQNREHMKSNNIDFTFNTAVKADRTKKCAICWICVTQHKHQIICHVQMIS